MLQPFFPSLFFHSISLPPGTFHFKCTCLRSILSDNKPTSHFSYRFPASLHWEMLVLEGNGGETHSQSREILEGRIERESTKFEQFWRISFTNYFSLFKKKNASKMFFIIHVLTLNHDLISNVPIISFFIDLNELLISFISCYASSLLLKFNFYLKSFF